MYNLESVAARVFYFVFYVSTESNKILSSKDKTHRHAIKNKIKIKTN